MDTRNISVTIRRVEESFEALSTTAATQIGSSALKFLVLRLSDISLCSIQPPNVTIPSAGIHRHDGSLVSGP